MKMSNDELLFVAACVAANNAHLYYGDLATKIQAEVDTRVKRLRHKARIHRVIVANLDYEADALLNAASDVQANNNNAHLTHAR